MRRMTYSVLLTAFVTTGASVAVLAATDEATKSDGDFVKHGMMSDMREMMKGCREMMGGVQTEKTAE